MEGQSWDGYEPGPDMGHDEVDYGYTVEDRSIPGDPHESYMNYYRTAGWTDGISREDTDNFPSWGADGNRYPLDPVGSIPMGSAIRTFDNGMAANGTMSDQLPTETVTEGWLNKNHRATPNNARVSDDSQYTRNTSMQQRDATRTNANALLRSTDEPRSGIKSRIPGMIQKVYSGGERHYDMTPREQDYILRPWRNRTAGTAPEQWLEGQEMYVSDNIQRQPPPDPEMGPNSPTLTDETSFGYTAEDYTYV